MPVFWLDEHDFTFPPPYLAERDGLIAVSGDLRPERLIEGYRSGAFPWYELDGKFFWYTPHPRMVLFPKELIVHKSMRSIFNQQKFEYTFDTAFEQVIRICAEIRRPGQEGTWISKKFIESYTALHQRGLAHSVEVWAGERLVGGLYGVSLGRTFFGESMFAHMSNASKAALITLVRALEQSGFSFIDCQQDTAHLRSLGARPIPRSVFLYLLNEAMKAPTLVGRWRLQEGRLHTDPV
ncbi:MAG: leucyl/phenylalanyl-tRNA--protein transferase [Saprospiraceae bacterium]|nr:leucyl/phenylalanyl-tRNA--protein transferase [Saprospiraceae bacterium]MDW8482778.1 leucyl/phenylalanyl-tRNA--protein transferase [Saprospiraceae bacterium]